MEVGGGCFLNVAVRVRQAYKSYGSEMVLRGLDLTVPHNSIYALLGPSGCGKTTLLNILTGQLTLDSGHILTTVTHQQNIGYMPQDVSLYEEFTILEIVNYYGRLYAINTQQIHSRAQQLLHALMLPSIHRVISTLSGGQQRRVSLCLTLLHDPDLVVLDEPTVGLDPVLSSSIWEKMLMMSQHKTIIITTHYIEEAKQAHSVGLMRDGVLLAEGNPLQIMESEGCLTLEQAFLKLSQQQTFINNNNNNNSDLNKLSSTRSLQQSGGGAESHLEAGTMLAAHRLTAHLLKHFYWMKRNPLVVVFVMMLPVIQCSLQYYSFGGDPKDVQIVVVNEEHQHCGAPQYPTDLTNCNTTFLSCAYIHFLSAKGVKLVGSSDLEKSLQEVAGSHTWASMYFPANFSRNLVDRIMSDGWARSQSLHLGEITLYTDNSDYLIGILTKKKVLEAYQAFTSHLYSECDWPVRLAHSPIRFEEPIYGEREPNFADSSIPPTVIIVAFFLPLTYTAISLLSERLSGQWHRTMASGTSMLEVMLAHSVVQACMWSVQTAAMLYLEYYLFQSPLNGSINLVIGLLLLNGIGGMLLGSTIALIGKSFTDVTILVIGIYFTILFLGGTTWPVEGMHRSLKALYYVIPLALPSESLRALSYRAWTLTHPTVYLGFLSSAAYLLLFLASNIAVVSLQKTGRKLTLNL